MQDVLSEINKLYETLKAKDKKLQDLISNTQEQLVILNKVKSDQDARDKSLEDREFKVSKIESVVVLKTEATRMLNEAKEIHDKTIGRGRSSRHGWIRNVRISHNAAPVRTPALWLLRNEKKASKKRRNNSPSIK